MECYYRSRPVDENGVPIRGYGQRMFREWRERGMFESTEQRIYDQARTIRQNGWLSELELETIRRTIAQEGEETHEMENVTRSADMDQNVMDEVEGVFKMRKMLILLQMRLRTYYPKRVQFQTKLERSSRRVQETTMVIHLRKLTRKDWKKKLGK